MKVQAAPGLRCPMEGDPRTYITDGPEGVEVADTAYYRRLLDDGSLQEVIAAPSKAAKSTTGGDQ